MTEDKIAKMLICAHLLPPPGNEVVIECLTEILRLRTGLEHIANPIKSFQKYTEKTDNTVDGLTVVYLSDNASYLKEYAQNILDNS